RKKETLELGAFDFLKKPATRADLVKAFDRIEEFTKKKLKQLLIIEDDKTQNIAIQHLIGNGDVQCKAAFSGQEAKEILAKKKFDCIIIDLGLPDISGMDLLNDLKQNLIAENTPIIVYTGKDLNKKEITQLNALANT